MVAKTQSKPSSSKGISAATKARPAKAPASSPQSKPAPSTPKPKLAEASARAKSPSSKRPLGPDETPNGVRRRDPGGRMDPEYVAGLLAKSGTPHGEPESAFLDRPRSEDALAEELGEGFVQGATSGEDADEGLLDPADRDEQEGGPFVETTGKEEYGREPDASNPEDAEVEAFPTTQSEG